MDDWAKELVVLLTAFVSGGGAVFFWRWMQERKEEKALAARLLSELLEAAHDLQKRLYNLVERTGWVYLKDESEPDSLVPSSIYRLARYLCWVEICRRKRAALMKGDSHLTSRLFDITDKIARTLSTDSTFTAPRIMLFTGPQKLLGESLIQESGSQMSCLSSAEFQGKHTELGASQVIDKLKQDLLLLPADIQAGQTDRLCCLQNLLMDIIDDIDPNRQRLKVDRDRLPRPTSCTS